MFFSFSPFLTGVLSSHLLSLFLPFSFFSNLTFKSQLHMCWPFPKMFHNYFIINQQIPSTAHKIIVSYANNPQKSAQNCTSSLSFEEHPPPPEQELEEDEDYEGSLLMNFHRGSIIYGVQSQEFRPYSQ
ncbi:hypothetical protein ABFS83_06G130900 [Erythranthe nasuta]